LYEVALSTEEVDSGANPNFSNAARPRDNNNNKNMTEVTVRVFNFSCYDIVQLLIFVRYLYVMECRLRELQK